MEQIYLNGSEDVRRASHTISSASDTILSGANILSNALYEHQRFMDEWLIRFEEILNKNIKEK